MRGLVSMGCRFISGYCTTKTEESFDISPCGNGTYTVKRRCGKNPDRIHKNTNSYDIYGYSCLMDIPEIREYVRKFDPLDISNASL